MYLIICLLIEIHVKLLTKIIKITIQYSEQDMYKT